MTHASTVSRVRRKVCSPSPGHAIIVVIGGFNLMVFALAVNLPPMPLQDVFPLYSVLPSKIILGFFSGYKPSKAIRGPEIYSSSHVPLRSEGEPGLPSMAVNFAT